MIIERLIKIHKHGKMLDCIKIMQREVKRMIKNKEYMDAKELNDISSDLFKMQERYYNDN